MTTVKEQRTGDSSSPSTAAELVDNNSIALDNSVNSEVAAVSGIGDLTVFKDFDCDLDSIHGGSRVPHQAHGGLGGTEDSQWPVLLYIVWKTHSLHAWRWTFSFCTLWKPAPAWTNMQAISLFFRPRLLENMFAEEVLFDWYGKCSQRRFR